MLEDLVEDWNTYIDFDNESHEYVSAPSQSLLQKWLREKHNIHVWCELLDRKNIYRAKVCDNSPSLKYYGFWDDKRSYEEALEIGLQEALKLIK